MADFMDISTFFNSDKAKAALESEMLDAENLIVSEDEADDILGKVNWAKAKLQENSEKVARKKEAMLQRLDDYEHELNDSLENYISWQESRLEAFARNQLKNRKGSVKLLNGSIQLKKPTIKYDYTNVEDTIKWLKAHGFNECIRVKEELDKTSLKSKFADTNEAVTSMVYNGETIPGVTLSLAKDPVFSISIPKKKTGAIGIPA